MKHVIRTKYSIEKGKYGLRINEDRITFLPNKKIQAKLVVAERHVIKCHIPLEELEKIEPVIHVPDASERIQKPASA